MTSIAKPAAPPLYRHPLGLPAGSVRATLVLMIVGLFWLIILLPPNDKGQVAQVPLYLYMLLALTLVFFAGHGHTIAVPGADQRSPWYLPRGFIRAFILIGTTGVVGWQAYNDPHLLAEHLKLDENQPLALWPWFLLALGGGFAFGSIVRLGPWRNYPWFQDVLAWLSLLAMLGLTILAIVHILINPDLTQRLNMTGLEWAVTAIVAFYFGARS